MQNNKYTDGEKGEGLREYIGEGLAMCVEN